VLVLVTRLQANQSIKSACGGPKNITHLDSTPPVGSALSAQQTWKRAAQRQCQITIFGINEINEMADV